MGRPAGPARRRIVALAAAVATVAAADVALIVGRPEDSPRTPRPPTAPGERPRRGGTLRALLTEDVDLDPQRADRPEAWFFARALHRGLMAFPNEPFPAGARPVPDLAEGPPRVSADGLTYRFRLRAGVRFGPPASRRVTARDVRAGIERLLRAGAGIARFLRDVRGADRILEGRRTPRLAGVATPNSRTVVIRLERRASDLLWMLAHPQASAVPYALAGRTRIAAAEISGAGPYRIASYLPERRIVLERNPAWSASSDPVRGAHVDRIDVSIGVSPRAADRRVSRGDADLALDAPPARGTPGDGILSAPGGCLRYLWINTRVEPFDDRRVRDVVATALAHDPVLPAVERGLPRGAQAYPADGILPPTVFGGRGADAAVAKMPLPVSRLLRSLGLPRGFATTLVVGDADEDRREAAVIRRELRRARIRVAVRRVPVASVYPDYYERPRARVPMGLATWCADWPGLGGRSVLGALLDERTVSDGGTTVYSQVRSRALDRRIDAALRASDEESATRLWRRADDASLGLSAVVPIAWTDEAVRVSGRVRGLFVHPLLARGDPANAWLVG